MKAIRVATVQFQHHPSDKAANLAIMHRFVLEAVRESAELVVFPECCISGYWHLRSLERSELESLAEPVPAGGS